MLGWGAGRRSGARRPARVTGLSSHAPDISCTPLLPLQGEGGGGYGPGTSGGEGFEFGVDPNIDPDLALALRVSLEEERARQNAAAAAGGGEAGAGAAATPAAAPAAAAGGAPASDMELDEDALLQQALAMSMQVRVGTGGDRSSMRGSRRRPRPCKYVAGMGGVRLHARQGSRALSGDGRGQHGGRDGAKGQRRQRDGSGMAVDRAWGRQHEGSGYEHLALYVKPPLIAGCCLVMTAPAAVA